MTKPSYGYILKIDNAQRSNCLFINLSINHMPRMDGTGPMGQGPRSGRGQGKCSRASNSTNSGLDRKSQEKKTQEKK